MAARQRPHVVLMDLRMPGLGGAEAIRRLRAADPAVRVLVLTTFDTDRDAAGDRGRATGYLLKDASGRNSWRRSGPRRVASPC